MNARIWLLAIEALDAADDPVTLRFASADYTDAVPWDVRLKHPALFSVSALGQTLARASRSGFGEAVLVNADGGLNHLVDYAMDGRACTLSLAQGGTVTEVLAGTVERVSFPGNEITVGLRDPGQALAEPHPHTVYAGSNALPDGLEGLATDIKGQAKPQVFGKVRNVTPKLVNTARLIYQVDTGSASTVTAVYDRGVSLTDGGAYPDLATLQSTAPGAGQFRAFEGYFRLGSTPAGQVTADVDGSPAGLGSVFEQIADQVGFYLDAARDSGALLDGLAQSFGGYWSVDAAGELRLQQLVEPGTPVRTLYDYEVTRIERQSAGAGSNGLPVWRVVVKADRVETVQEEVAAAATNAARVAAQYREAVAESSAAKTRHPLAGELVIESDLRSLTDAQSQADRLRTLLSVRRDRLDVTAKLQDIDLTAVELGVTVRVEVPQLGYEAGRNFLVLGYTLDARTNTVELHLWG
jgi:hypothetical protein